MTVRTTSLGGTDWTDGEVLTGEDLSDTINAGVGFLFKKVSMTQDTAGATSASFGSPGTSDIKTYTFTPETSNNIILGIYISFTKTSTISSLLEEGCPGMTYAGVKVDGYILGGPVNIGTDYSASSYQTNTSNTFAPQTCGVGTYTQSVSGTFWALPLPAQFQTGSISTYDRYCTIGGNVMLAGKSSYTITIFGGHTKRYTGSHTFGCIGTEGISNVNITVYYLDNGKEETNSTKFS